jgi:NTE family protein
MALKSESVSLVLGSGGARGLAHIGVIHWLEEHNYEIRSVAGSSMGALIGGIYALGRLADFENWVRAITKVDIVSLLDVSLVGGGLVRGDKIIETLKDFLGDAMIEDLPIKYTAVASNIATEKEVWISNGPLFDAIRASISIPLFFTPATYGGERLVDGGVLNPVPIAPTFDDHTDMTIAVNLNGPRVAEPEGRIPERLDDATPSDLGDQIKQFIGKLSGGVAPSGRRELGFQEVASQSFETMQRTIARHKLAVYPPDLLIEISRSACKVLEFDRAQEMIDLGYRTAQEAYDRYVP